MDGDLGEQRGTVNSKHLGGGDGAAYTSSKFQKYLIKYKCLVFPTVLTGSCVVCIHFRPVLPKIKDPFFPKPRTKQASAYGGAPHKCWNLGPQLPCHATARMHHVHLGIMTKTQLS